ncbi:MAG: hypothetical protein OHK0022_26430 [Roseiflexaceae bacterium]
MSGGIKAGLLFGLIALIAVPVVSILPYVGVLLCGPIIAMALGTGAGYLGLRWSDRSAGIGTGVLAGGITGIGALLGCVIFFVVAFNLVLSEPGISEAVIDQIREQQPNNQMTNEQLQALLPITAVLAGLCVGIIQLLFTLGTGALGGWLAKRNQPAADPLPAYTAPTLPMANPTPAPSTSNPVASTKSEPPPPLAPLD